MTAKASIAVLQGRPGAAFRRLLMTRTTLWRKCDAFVQVSQQGRETESETERSTHRDSRDRRLYHLGDVLCSGVCGGSIFFSPVLLRHTGAHSCSWCFIGSTPFLCWCSDPSCFFSPATGMMRVFATLDSSRRLSCVSYTITTASIVIHRPLQM